MNIEQKTTRISYEQAVKQDYARNACCFIGWDFLWGLGLSFALFGTMVPAYLAEIGAPKSFIAFTTSLLVILTPLQIIVGYYFRNRARKLWIFISFTIAPTAWLGYNIIFLCYRNTVPLPLQLTFFCFCMILFFAPIIGNQSLYNSMITDCIPLKKRGTLYGSRNFSMAMGILVMAYPARLVLNHWPEPYNYLVAFTVATIIYMLSCLIFLGIREHRDPGIIADKKGSSKFNKPLINIRIVIRKMLNNVNYRIFIFFQILFSVSMVLGSLIVVFAKESLSLKGSDILVFTIIQMLSAGVVCVVLGKLADRIGYRLIGIIQGFVLSLGFFIYAILTMSLNACPVVVYLGFFLYSSVIGVSQMVIVNMSAELLPKQSLSMILAAANLVLAPVVLIIMPLAGFVVDLTNSYITVFVIGGILSLLSAFGYMFLVKEPRKRRMYVVRYIRRL